MKRFLVLALCMMFAVSMCSPAFAADAAKAPAKACDKDAKSCPKEGKACDKDAKSCPKAGKTAANEKKKEEKK